MRGAVHLGASHPLLAFQHALPACEAPYSASRRCINSLSGSGRPSLPCSASNTVAPPFWPGDARVRGFFGGAEASSKKYEERRLVGYTQEQLFDVVAQASACLHLALLQCIASLGLHA